MFVYVVSLSEEFGVFQYEFVAKSPESALPRIAALYGNYGIPFTYVSEIEESYGFRYIAEDNYGDEVTVYVERTELV